MIASSPILRLEPQPDFPATDLTPGNTEILKYIIGHEAGVAAYGSHLESHQRQLHLIANRALSFTGTQTDNSPREDSAFSSGFSAMETITAAVGGEGRTYNMADASRQAAILLIQPGESVELDLVSQSMFWQDTQPNAWSVVAEAGAAKGESLSELRARTIGAFVAYKLQSKPDPIQSMMLHW